MMGTEFYVGSGPSDIYPFYTEIIRLNCPITKEVELDGAIGIALDGEITREIVLDGRTYK